MIATLLRCSVQTTVDVLVSTSFRIVVVVVVVFACIQGIDNYRSETNHVSRVYSAAAVL